MEKRKVVNVMLTMVVLTLVLVVNVGANPEKIVHNPWDPTGVYLGETKKDISLKSDISLCQPTPTDNTGEGVKWDWCNTDFSYSLQQTEPDAYQYFPLNDLPSGGNSGRISKSEMVIAVIDILDNDPKDGWIMYSWYKKNAEGSGTDKLLVQTEKLSIPACGGYPHFGGECGMYGSYEQYSYIGHFSNEIEEGGYYYVIIDTKWGEARIDFEVFTPDSEIHGDRVQTIITPVPTVQINEQNNVQTQVASPVATVVQAQVASPVVTPVPRGITYDTGHYVGSGLESFFSGVVHGIWDGVFR